MSTVPDNQKIEKDVKIIFNEEFAQKANNVLPQLIAQPCQPARLVRFVDDSSTYFGKRPVLDLPSSELPDQLWGRGDQFTLDFGIHRVGYVSFKLDAEGINVDAPCRLRLTFGESPFDVTESMEGVDTWISTSWLPDEVINVDFMPENVSIPRRHAFRFLRVEIVDTSPKYKVKFSDVVCRAVSAVEPDTPLDIYDYGDPALQDIDEISMLTLRDCMQTVFEDGPRRDRRAWIGDLRLQALSNYPTFRNHDLVKRNLYMFAALPREDSSLPACMFEKPALRAASDYIVDYDTLFGAMVYDYVLASGDIETGQSLWQTVQGSLLKSLEHLDRQTDCFDSSRTSAWKFLDWAEGLDTSAGLHGVLLYSLKAVNDLASLLKIEPPYTAEIDRMTAGAAAFVDQDSGHIISGPDRQVSLASAAWLTIAGALPKETCQTALLKALKSPCTVKPLTPYLWHHICHALATVELYDECIELLRSYWGGMVKAGADTFWECFDAENPRASPYGDVRNNSFCHAWSCTPSWLLRVALKDHLGAKVEKTCTMRELDAKWIERKCRD